MTFNRRTPLSRKTPLARTGFLSRSLTALPRVRSRPRRHASASFRRRYKAANRCDELALSFPSIGPQSVLPFESATGLTRRDVRIVRFGEPAKQLHHVLGGIAGNVRHDELTFVIHLSEASHLWAERYPEDGVCLSAAVKIAKREWDENRVVDILGCDSFAEWISARRPYWEFVVPVWERLCAS